MINLLLTSRLERIRLRKVDGEVFRPVPEKKGGIALSLKIDLESSEDSVDDLVERVLLKVTLGAVGEGPIPADNDPIFSIVVVAEGQYQFIEKVSVATLLENDATHFLAVPVYAMAANKVQEIAGDLGLPRIRIPYSRVYPESFDKVGSEDLPPAVKAPAKRRKRAQKPE